MRKGEAPKVARCYARYWFASCEQERTENAVEARLALIGDVTKELEQNDLHR
jgi:hypothetical protein